MLVPFTLDAALFSSTEITRWAVLVSLAAIFGFGDAFFVHTNVAS